MLEGWLPRAKIYTDEFKRDVVAMVESGMAPRQVGQDMGVSRSSLHKWVQDARFKVNGMVPSTDAIERKKMAAALERIRELEQENEVLRRAVAYLSQAHIVRLK